MDRDESNLNANNYKAGKSNIKSPLSPELSTKKRRKSKKYFNVTLKGSNSNSTSEFNSRVSQGSSGLQRPSNFSGVSQESHDDRVHRTSERNILVASTVSPKKKLLTTDVHTSSKLNDDHDGKSPCSSINTFSEFNCRKGQEDVEDLEKSPILKTYSHKKSLRRSKKRILDKRDEFEMSPDAATLGSSHLHKTDSKLNDPSDSSMLPIEDSDISFSVLEEICQTTELSFNCDKVNYVNSVNNDSSRSKPASALCEKHSSNRKNNNKNTSCDKLVNLSSKLIEKDNNCIDKTKIKIIVSKRKEDNLKCGTIYVNNSSKNNKPIANSGSIETLLESTKLLDDAESVSYLEETKKQKEFKFMCRKEKLDDGSYLCFEDIQKSNKIIDKQQSKGISKISAKYENEFSCEKSSLMDKYNIDMNNTLNIFSDQLDDLIANAENSNYGKKAIDRNNSSLKMNSEYLNEIREQRIIPINKSCNLQTFARSSNCQKNEICEEGSLNSSVISNKSKRDTPFQESKSEKSVPLKDLTSNPTLSLKVGKVRAKHERYPRNGQIVSEILTNYFDLTSQLDSTIDRKRLKYESLISPTNNMDCNVLDDTVTRKIASENTKLMQISGKHRLENETCDAVQQGFSTANGKSIFILEEALAKAKTIFSENETCDAAVSGFSTANGKLIYVSEEALSKSKTFLSEEETCNEGFSGSSNTNRRSLTKNALANKIAMLSNYESDNLEFSEFSTAIAKSITVSGKPLLKEKTLLSEKENDYCEFKEFSTVREKPISIPKDVLKKAQKVPTGKEPFNSGISGFSTATGKSIEVSEEALTKARSFFSEKEPCDTAFSKFSTANGKSVHVSEEALVKARTLLSEKESEDIRFSGFSNVKGESIQVSEEALVKAKTMLAEKAPSAIDFSGTSTAKGKSIQVSEEALGKARILLSGKEACGFSTAKGKPIQVSAEALAKARTMLAEKKPCEISLDDFSTAKETSISIPDESLVKARTLLSEKESNELEFSGFSTARGKLIQVSEKALSKARLFLSEKESEDALARARTLFSDKETCGTAFSGFSTAKEKSIQVSEESLAKARTILAEKEPCETRFAGFSTAKGESISVSEEALIKARTLLSEKESKDLEYGAFSTVKGKSISVTEDASAKARISLSKKEPCDTAFCGFSTAKGKSIQVSEESLAKARTILAEKEPCETRFAGFSTAKGESISVSEEALIKARTLLSEKESKDLEYGAFSTVKGKSISVTEDASAKARISLSKKEPCDTAFCGFSTAKGKSIQVSEESLAKARTILAEKEPCETRFAGFSTAKGESISVSEEALIKARTLLFEKESKDLEYGAFSTVKRKSISVTEDASAKARISLIKKEPCDTAFCGFSTAKGKSIQVSEEALAKARTILAEKEPCQTRFAGFSTAKGESISVSEEALIKARTLLSEKESKDLEYGAFSTVKGKSISVTEDASAKAKISLSTKEPCDTAFCGFLTAKGKSIQVSEEALAKARTMLDEKESEDLKFNGFSTAKGKSRLMSEEALVKARSLVSEKEPFSETFSGFSTAKGESIMVSGEALAKAKLILTEKESYGEDSSVFTTANGKSILVSEKALVEAQKMLLDESSVNVQKLDEPSDLVDSSFNCNAFSQKQQSLSCQISDMKKDDLVENVDDLKLENHSGLSVIKEEPSLQDSCIDHQNFESLLNSEKNTNSPSLQSQFYEDMPCFTLSFVDEVSESTAAFLADEEISQSHNPPVWLKTFVTSPSIVQDRSGALSPILCSESDLKMKKKRACSPVLGQCDRFKKRKKRLTFSKKQLDNSQEAGCSTPVSNSKLMRNPEDQYNSFIGDLQTSTPIALNRTKIKRVIQVDEPNCNREKKLKLMDCWDDSQVDQDIFYQLDVIEGRRKAAEKQELLLKNGKDKSLTKMCKGALFVKKQLKNRISLKSLVKFPRRMLSSSELITEGIKQSVIGVTHENAVEFRFSSSNSLSNEICESNSNGVFVGDGALVVLSDDGSAGLKEISRAFLASPGVDPTLISLEWVANHYRSIVWKLAATERSFPHLFAGIYLTLDNVLFQLKYRYDREIDDCQRPCLRKILETDESAARRMILCVSEISVKQSSTTKDLRLTDGWYGISASLDEEMVCLIDKGKVAVGTKLVVQGCELLNCEQGHDPLQVPDTVQLKLHTNSTRRAKWDSRLGFCQIQGSISVHLKDILPKGGNVGRVDVLVARVYPLVYLFKTECGKTVVYSRKREEQECLLNERKMTELMEKVQSQVQKEIDEINSHKSNSTLKRNITNQYDEPLSTQDLVDSDQIPTKDQIRIISNLREKEQRKYQEILRQKLDEKMSENGPEKRTSTPMLKVRLMDSRQANEDKSMSLNTAMLTVWKPTEDVENVLTEGNIISLYNITAQGKRSGELQLSTGRQTKYSIISKSEAFSRLCHLLCDISHNFNPLFSEINTVGLVVHVETSATSVETAYLTDNESNFLGIRFWGGIKKYGWQSCVCVGSEICCSNLEWRPNAFKYNVPYVFVTELSSFSANPRSKYLQNALDQLKISLKGVDLSEFVSNSKEKLFDILNGRSKKWDTSTGMFSPSASSEANKSTDHSNNPTPSDKNKLSESPISCIKSKVLLEKMQRLHGYGNPPSITAMPNLQVSPALKKDFKTPNKTLL